MSNYTSQNLIAIPASQVPVGTLAMKVGNDVFTAGSLTLDEGDAYVVVSDSGTLYAQKLKFNGTQASDSGPLLELSNVMTFNTGHPEPQGGDTPAASMDFYKCASVNTSNHSWTGYKAVLSNGIYKFESNVTSGLTYGSGFTPEVGKVYSDEARIQSELFGIPTNGLVFFAPLSSAAQTAETGQNLITIGNVTYQTVAGVPCCSSTVNDGIAIDELMKTTDPGIPKTMSCWIYLTEWPTSSTYPYIFMCMQDGGGTSFAINSEHVANAARWSPSTASSGNYVEPIFGTLSLTTWYNLVCTDDGATFKLYLNGVHVNSVNVGEYRKAPSDTLKTGITCADSTPDFGPYNLRGYMASARIYNRALSAAEVFALSKEFTPAA